MLTTIAVLFASALVGAALVQLWIALIFEGTFRKRESKPIESTTGLDQRVAVLMSVRGADPSLERAIDGVLNQDHPNYEVHVIVDHVNDEAWDRLQAVQQNHVHRDRLKLQLMKEPPRNCGLKCHCLVQAAESLPKDIEIIALLDADVTPHASWLSSLVVRLADPTVGGVTGTQWFEPGKGDSIGAWWRSTWNGGAMIPTIFFANPWAGSFAMRRQDLQRSGLLSTWRESIVDDGPIRECLGSVGLKVVFAPSMIMINRENCSPSYVLRWTTRMLTWSRLHEPTFYLSQLHAAFSNLVLTGNAVILIASIIFLVSRWGIEDPVGASAWYALRISLAALVVAGLLCLSAYESGRRCVGHSCGLRGESLPAMTWRARWNVFWSAAPAHWAYGIACWKASFNRVIQWRGIQYRLGSKNSIERLNYEPFARDRDTTQSI